MAKNYKILGISGSLRQRSFNSAALRAAQRLAPENISIEIASISDIPFYNADVQEQGFPESVEKLIDKLVEADALLIVSPEYNYSVPGVLKNTIDWLSRSPKKPFDYKAVAIMGASPGMIGTARMQYHLRQMMVFLNAYVLNKPEIMINQANKKFDENLNLTDETTAQKMVEQLQALVDFSDKFKK
jgi:chromate reductase